MSSHARLHPEKPPERVSLVRDRVIDCKALAERFWRLAPDNESRSEGYALVAVLETAAFLRERIPGSMRMPAKAAELAERFDPGKEIVLYAAGPASEVSRRVADLLEAGFRNVLFLAGGLRGWRDSGQPLAGTAHS